MNMARRPPNSLEWVGLIIAMLGLVATLGFHVLKSAREFQQVQDELRCHEGRP